eukprot:CAMPEP_0180605742 /NCGR_PEP_ID=MMETSP1037_2-20121125/26779_1 /TAXON_ID=632150 /ORGANISM="Azadinium spinosum, Strain 3D9" /LENGTH=167 /DNA_ID=CAMNT_0022624875 /DNA_START=63 /DNA_END=566 /DNA_ORIENTATION=+
MMQLFARTLEGETVMVEAQASEEIGCVKARLLGEDCASMGLIFGGRSLVDDETLAECSIQGGATLHMVPHLLGGGDGTPAMGKRHKKTHGLCVRCGKRSFHYQKKRCAACGYPAAKIRSYEWSKKAKRRRLVGSGRMTYLKTLPRRFKNGFREGTTAPARKKKPAAQ